MVYCCISDKDNFDKYNILSTIAIYGFSLFIAVFAAAFLYSIGNLIFGLEIYATIYLFSIFFIVVWGIVSVSFLTLNNKYCKKSETHLIGTQNSLFSPNKPHHGIIFAQSIEPLRKMFISDSIDLLVSLFNEKIPFKVYPIYCKDDFERVYSNPNIKWLWIIGHGWRGGFVFSENNCEGEIEYSRYPKNPNLLFIAQLHCNNGSGESLIERNNLKPDHDLGHLRFPFQNRCYITKKVKSFLHE
jgi:hypothetical protein